MLILILWDDIMSWDIKYNEDSQIIEISYTGDVTGMDLHEAATKRLSMQKKTGAKLILADASLTRSNPPIMDIYELPDRLYSDNKAIRDSRIAFVLPKNKKFRELAYFYQTAVKNRGWIIELFENREDAFSWLIEFAKPIVIE